MNEEREKGRREPTNDNNNNEKTKDKKRAFLLGWINAHWDKTTVLHA